MVEIVYLLNNEIIISVQVTIVGVDMCGLAVRGGGGGPGDGGRRGQQTQGRRQQRGGHQVGGARQPRPLAQRRVQAVEHEGAWKRQYSGY